MVLLYLIPQTRQIFTAEKGGGDLRTLLLVVVTSTGKNKQCTINFRFSVPIRKWDSHCCHCRCDDDDESSRWGPLLEFSRSKVLRHHGPVLPPDHNLGPCSLPMVAHVAGHVTPSAIHALDQRFPTLGIPGILGLPFPKAFATSYADQSFWELTSKNTWISQGWAPRF